VKYRVRIIDDDDLPEGVPWAYVRQHDRLTLVLKASAARDTEALATTLEDAWSAFRAIDHDDLLSWESVSAAS
jgi:hypothetical protein